MTIDPVIHTVLAICFSLLFALAARHKIFHAAEMRGVIAAYRLLPSRLAKATVYGLAGTELLISIGLLLPWMRVEAAWLAALILSLYGLAMVINLLRGNREISCGCSFGSLSQRLSWRLVIRNGALALSALLVVVPVGVRAMTVLDFATTLFAILAAGLLYAVGSVLISNHHQIAG